RAGEGLPAAAHARDPRHAGRRRRRAPGCPRRDPGSGSRTSPSGDGGAHPPIRRAGPCLRAPGGSQAARPGRSARATTITPMMPGPDNRPRVVISPFAFPPEEYPARVMRARRAMEAARLDALLLSDDRNFFYFTGAGGPTPREDKARPQFVLILLSGEVAALVSHARCIPFRESSWVPTLRTYDGLGTERIREALADLVERVAPRARTIGMELGYEQRLGISVADYEALRARFPDRRLVDASEVLWGLRMVKSPAELARTARAVEITDQAFARVFPDLRPGMTEREIVGRLHGEMARLGASTSWALIPSGTYDRGGLVIRHPSGQ